jgi:hypothetical protein
MRRMRILTVSTIAVIAMSAMFVAGASASKALHIKTALGGVLPPGEALALFSLVKMEQGECEIFAGGKLGANPAKHITVTFAEAAPFGPSGTFCNGFANVAGEPLTVNLAASGRVTVTGSPQLVVEQSFKERNYETCIYETSRIRSTFPFGSALTSSLSRRARLNGLTSEPTCRNNAPHRTLVSVTLSLFAANGEPLEATL